MASAPVPRTFASLLSPGGGDGLAAPMRQSRWRHCKIAARLLPRAGRLSFIGPKKNEIRTSFYLPAKLRA